MLADHSEPFAYACCFSIFDDRTNLRHKMLAFIIDPSIRFTCYSVFQSPTASIHQKGGGGGGTAPPSTHPSISSHTSTPPKSQHHSPYCRRCRRRRPPPRSPCSSIPPPFSSKINRAHRSPSMKQLPTGPADPMSGRTEASASRTPRTPPWTLREASTTCCMCVCGCVCNRGRIEGVSVRVCVCVCVCVEGTEELCEGGVDHVLCV
jgi:hypothetical protein